MDLSTHKMEKKGKAVAEVHLKGIKTYILCHIENSCEK
jgi:hypothetical protein